MADDEILSALYPLWRERKRRRAKESYVRRGGWAELCPRLSDRHKPSQPVQCSSSKGFPPPPLPNSHTWSLASSTQHVCLILSENNPLFRKCLPFFLARAQLFNRNCLSFQQLSICFATKMHLYSTDSFSQSPLSRIYQHSNVQGFYISHAQGCSQTCTVWLFCRKDRAVFIFLFSIVC